MTIFYLPDLGEGLPEAEIHEWFVKEGDWIEADEPMVSMETAKAVVDVPSPEKGRILKLHGKPGDVIKTGEPLVTFEAVESAKKQDKGTVVGNLEESLDTEPDDFIVGSAQSSRNVTTPAIRMLAKKLGIDLSTLKIDRKDSVITRDDVEQAHKLQQQPPEGFEPLHGVRRTMLKSMIESHEQVVPVSIFDEVDIGHWQNEDITVRLIQALSYAATKEPALNAWFNGKHAATKHFKELHLGLAMDTADGLFVPVIHDAGTKNAQQLRQEIETLKHDVHQRTAKPEVFKNPTFTLSNFGKFSGRFASPIIVPPMVGILAVGKLYSAPAVHDGKIVVRMFLPLSLSFDHRAATGGEATRFLGAVIESLKQ